MRIFWISCFPVLKDKFVIPGAPESDVMEYYRSCISFKICIPLAREVRAVVTLSFLLIIIALYPTKGFNPDDHVDDHVIVNP